MAKKSVVNESMANFFERLEVMHFLLAHGKYLGVGNLVRSNCEWMLKHALLQAGFPLEKVDRINPHKLIEMAGPVIKQRDILMLFRFIFQQANIRSHDRVSGEMVATAERLFHLQILLYLWFTRHILGSYQPMFKTLEQVFALKDEKKYKGILENETGESYTNIEDLPYAEDIDKLLLNEKVAIHHSALVYMEAIEEWKKPLIQAAILLLNLDIDIPFLYRVHKHAALPVTSINMEDMFTVISIQVNDAHIILYIGENVSVDQWEGVNRIISNKKNYIEIIRDHFDSSSATYDIFDSVDTMLHQEEIISSMKKVLFTQKSIAVETKQLLQHDITKEKHRGYREICSADTGFSQSNIALLQDDNAMRMALQYPLSAWRLFLHPKQKNVVNSKEQFSMVYGGPGTGKTVVLLHRIMKKVFERRSSLANAQRQIPFRLLLITFTKQLAENNSKLLNELHPILKDYVYVKDLGELLELRAKKKISFSMNKNLLMLEINGMRESEYYYVTDVFIDEFQDIPSKDIGFVTGLLRWVASSKTSLSCAYDTAQKIYHSDFDPMFWENIFRPVRFELSYCYRLSQKISLIAQKHRSLLLDYAGSVLRIDPVVETLKEPSQKDLQHAFSGGSFELVPCSQEAVEERRYADEDYSSLFAQLNKVKKYIYRLLESYLPNEIGIVYFDETLNTIQRRSIDKEIREIESSFNITFFNNLAVKGLEFKAGIILFGESPFRKYQNYLREGAKFGEVERFCMILDEFVRQKVLYKLEKGRDPRRAVEMFSSLVTVFLSVIRDKTDSIPSNNELKVLLKSRLIDLDKKGYVLHIYWNLLKTEQPKFLLNLHRYAMDLKKKPEDIHYLRETLHSILQATARVSQLSIDSRKIMFNNDINRALLDMNQFYVSITRFRETVYLFYNRVYRLEKILPHADSAS